MMNYIYPFILAMHSLWRWEVLIVLTISLVNFFYKRKKELPFSPTDQFLVKITVSSFYIQLVLGFSLYVLSPITQYFLQHFDEAVHLRQIRFFGMEHSSMMIIAAICLTLGALKSKNADTNDRRFKILLIWFGLALLIVLSSIPWEFSPLTSRPSFRSF
ncbi:hypothetical protein [Sphingobacterium sp.]|uniref:hypothetical protein n=1 Tax=Sphingobacterium sp. TaxID=341027 RepID=UPI0026006BC9|nr:hypothetical protein [Sphingobacterium sp.]